MVDREQVRRDVQQAAKPMDDTISMYLLEGDCEVVYAAFRCAKHADALLAELEQAERERDDARQSKQDFRLVLAETYEKLEAAEAQLAVVPALVDSWRLVERYVEDFSGGNFRCVFKRGEVVFEVSVPEDVWRAFDTKWEQAQGEKP